MISGLAAEPPEPSALVATSIAFVAAALALVVLVRFARQSGLADDGSDAPERKAQRSAVPLVGGTALMIACGVLVALEAAGGAWSFALVAPDDPSFRFERAALAASLCLAFATGLVDDLRERGLSPVAKLAGQTAAGLALAGGLVLDGEPAGILARAVVVFLAVAAQNIANTFDHGDGALGSIAAAGTVAARAPFAGALVAFLGANLSRSKRGGPPHAYLGDSGSHVLGILLLASPAGHAALTLPALDLARVVVARVRAGDPFWRGDRRHLGHRLAGAGRGPLSVVALVLACTAPAIAAFVLARGHAGIERGPAFALGALGSAALLGLVLRLHPARPPG